MWTDLIGWASSIVLLVLLASKLRRRPTDGTAGSLAWIAGEMAAMTTLLSSGLSLAGSFSIATAALLGSNLAFLLVREWRARRRRPGYTIVLQAANDDGAELKLRVLSHVLEKGEMPLYQSR